MVGIGGDETQFLPRIQQAQPMKVSMLSLAHELRLASATGPASRFNCTSSRVRGPGAPVRWRRPQRGRLQGVGLNADGSSG